jgi:UDP-N-acetylmuramoyl-tripeptide--D-alanyl-D-alanine ligase
MRHIDKSLIIQALPYLDSQKAFEKLPSQIGLSIDSRTLKNGEIFIAIRGYLKDGHDYIQHVNKKGASIIIAENKYKARFLSNQTNIIFVEDTLKLFFDMARYHLKSMKAIKIAITGSNGKTTTKEMLKAALIKNLGEKYVYASLGNKNNHFGVPLSALEVNSEHKVAIFEMGMNHSQEISLLCSIIEPNIGTITNISHAHEGNFENGIGGVQAAKGELFASLANNSGCAVVNLDDNLVLQESLNHHFKRRVTFGKKADADVRIVKMNPFFLTLGMQELSVKTAQEELKFAIPLAGPHHAKNALCALSLVKALDLPLKDAASGFMAMAQTLGRMSIFTHKNNYTLINDGYNANPASMKAGIIASRQISATRRIAVIGPMGELGPNSAAHHYHLGRLIAFNFEYLFICGVDAKPVAEGAKSTGMANEKIRYFDSSIELVEPLKNLLQKDDLVFIKGSSSANMQLIFYALN